MSAHTPLVIRFGAMGDMILLVPMLKALQQRYGQPCTLISSGGWTPPLMQRVPACGEVSLLTSRRAPYFFNRSQWQLVDFLRRRPPGPVYVMEPDEKPLSLLRRGGVGPEWICTMRDLPRLPGEHVATHALRLARQTPVALGTDTAFNGEIPAAPDTRLTLSEADRRDCAAWLESRHLAGAPLVLIQPGNKKTMKGGPRQRGSNAKYWPEDNWAEVIAAVRRLLPSSRVLICGAPSERPLAEDIASRLPGEQSHVLIATDDLPVSRLLALQERAHSMISVDTGPAHAAAAMGCPLVVMFARKAHIAAELYAPIPTAAPVKILLPSDPSPDAGLLSVTPATVIQTWQGLLPACRS
ncbi:glycosyltransferase family 9 protein [Opitutus sp. GAS368]|uniref:glycosyltransferase family 9 protein n=1 Tax=Opitutus sp. GAS368 TaxID=1882749 RepID=UPI0012FD7D3F|nr:glycosyltransferase family 9 protein [Opitutus sp. GAS368]